MGGDDPDILLINGAPGADTLRLTTDVFLDSGELFSILNGATSVVGDIELIDARLFGGADVMTVDDLTSTKVVDVMFNNTFGADGAVDVVIVNGTSQDENFSIAPHVDQLGATRATTCSLLGEGFPSSEPAPERPTATGSKSTPPPATTPSRRFPPSINS